MTVCDRCDGSGSKLTYANQASLPIGGRVRCVDWCIHRIVAALNAGGIETIASCCGHGDTMGRIDLADGRVLGLFLSQEEADLAERAGDLREELDEYQLSILEVNDDLPGA